MEGRSETRQFTIVAGEETSNEGGLKGFGEIAVDWFRVFLEAGIKPAVEGLDEKGGRLVNGLSLIHISEPTRPY